MGLIERDSAVAVALGLGIVELFGWGVFITRRSGRGFLRSLTVALVYAALGMGVVALRVAFGH